MNRRICRGRLVSPKSSREHALRQNPQPAGIRGPLHPHLFLSLRQPRPLSPLPSTTGILALLSQHAMQARARREYRCLYPLHLTHTQCESRPSLSATFSGTAHAAVIPSSAFDLRIMVNRERDKGWSACVEVVSVEAAAADPDALPLYQGVHGVRTPLHSTAKRSVATGAAAGLPGPGRATVEVVSVRCCRGKDRSANGTPSHFGVLFHGRG